MPLLPTKTLSISIDRHCDEVYEFVSNPANLPQWARGLCRSVRKSNGGWIAETPQAPLKILFTEHNDLGVVDHYVFSPAGEETYVPLRVVPNGTGAEVLFTLFRPPGMTGERFSEDAALVVRDLEALKRLLERDDDHARATSTRQS